MTIFGFILSTCYIPGWTGYAIPTGWLFLSATLPLILRREMWKIFNPFFLYVCLSMTWSMVFVQGVYDLWRLAILSGAFLLGQLRVEARSLYIGMGMGLLISTIIAIFQALGWHDFTEIYSRPAGLFVNPNVLGETAALVSIGLFAYGVFWPLLWTVPSIFLSESRTALAALAAVSTVYIWNLYKPATIAIVIFVAAMMYAKPLETLSYRWQIWESTIHGFTWLGRGAGSYILTGPVFATFHTEDIPAREENAHNDFLQLIYQYGLGTVLLLPIFLVALIGPLGPERYLFIAFCIIAFFNFPLAIPTEGFLGAFAMGRLWRDRDLVWGGWLLRRCVIGGRVEVAKP
jgi:hypothetical protein